MERVERHLGAGFANRLRGDGADHLAAVDLGGQHLASDGLEQFSHARFRRAAPDELAAPKVGQDGESDGGEGLRLDGLADEALGERAIDRDLATREEALAQTLRMEGEEDACIELVDKRVALAAQQTPAAPDCLGRPPLDEQRGAEHRLVLFKRLELHPLEARRVKVVAAVRKVDDALLGVANRAVAADAMVLHRLHLPSLNVACGGRLDGRVDEALSPSHRVEKKLVRLQAERVRIGDKPLAGERVIGEGKAGQRARPLLGKDAVPLDGLLADAAADLGEVDRVALGAGVHHRPYGIVRLEFVLDDAARLH